MLEENIESIGQTFRAKRLKLDAHMMWNWTYNLSIQT